MFMSEIWKSSFLCGFEIVFDYVANDFSFGPTEIECFFIGQASSHKPTQFENICSNSSDFFVMLFNNLGNALRTRGQEAEAKKFETSMVNGVS